MNLAFLACGCVETTCAHNKEELEARDPGSEEVVEFMTSEEVLATGRTSPATPNELRDGYHRLRALLEDHTVRLAFNLFLQAAYQKGGEHERALHEHA